MTRPFTTAGEDSTTPPVGDCHCKSGSSLPSGFPSNPRRSGPPRNAVHSSKPIVLPVDLDGAAVLGAVVVDPEDVSGAAVLEVPAVVSGLEADDGAPASGASVEHAAASKARAMRNVTERKVIGSFDWVQA